MKKKYLLILLFTLIVFFLMPSSIKASYKASDFKNEKCFYNAIPDEASSIYKADNGVFTLSGTTYKNYKDLHKDDEVNSDGSGNSYSNSEVDDNIVYFSTSKDKKTLIAYVPNYSSVLKDEDYIKVLKLMGLYNENFKDCNSTYTAKARVVSYKDINDDITSNEQDSTSEIISIKNIIYILIAIVIALIIINFIKRGNKKILAIYFMILSLLTFLLAFTLNSSYALSGNESKVKNVKTLSVTSNSVYLNFNLVKGASSYEVCYKKSSDKNFKCNLETKTNKALIKNLDNDSYYNIKIRAKDNNSYGMYSSVLTSKTLKKDGYYYYLNNKQKTVYNELYNGIKKRNKNIEVSPILNKKEFNNIYHYVRYDHPEIFYMDVSYYYYYDYKGNVAEIYKYYNSTFNNYANSKKKFDTITNKIISKAKNYKTDYEKEQYIAYYLAKNVKYDDAAYKKYSKKGIWNENIALTQSAYSSLVKGKTFCAGYSASFKYLLNKLNIDSYTIGGVGKRSGYSGDHAWNLVKLDDGYYNVDITWLRKNSKSLNLSYFNLEKNKFDSGHIRDKEDKLAPSSIGNLYLNFNSNNVINLNSNESIILKGKSKKLKVKVDNKYTKKSKLLYKSSNKNIISITKKGKIKALKVGKAKITVYTKEGISSSKTIIVKKKLICTKNSGSYYNKNGKKVSVNNYYKSCNPKCSIKNNTYYNNVGKPVNKDSYYRVCSGKCINSGNIYYDKNSKKVSKEDFYKSCNPKCTKQGNTYYDKNGKPSSYDEYNKSCFSDNGKYEVTFSIGKKSTETKVKAGEKVEKPKDPTRKGYNFEGWYKDEDYSKEYDFTNNVNNDVIIYAKWTKEEYTVKYETNGGTPLEDSKVLYNEMISKPFDPVKEGYYFTGWYIDKELTIKYSFMTKVKDDLTLYAGYSLEEVNTHEVTFIPGNGHDPFIKEVEDNQLLEVPVVDSNNEEYIFDNWYIDEEKETLYNFDTPVTEDITLYGKWKTKEGLDIIEAPDTASAIELIVIITGSLFIIVGVFYTLRRYNLIKKNKK